MPRLFTATFLLLLSLVTVSSQAQSTESETDITPWFETKASESEDMSELARPRRRPRTVHRCCAKPNYGPMYCRESTDRLVAWSRVINACESRHGNGNCVSGCRRLL